MKDPSRVPDHQVSCVLPAYNEEACLRETVAGLADAGRRHTQDHEIIVVDDGSTDGTGRVLEELATRYSQLRVIRHPVNRGYGAALNSGFAGAKFPLLFFTDADGQFEPEDIGLLLARIDEADIVTGYRIDRRDLWLRKLLSRGFRGLVRRTLSVPQRDINCAFKLIRRDALQRLELACDDFCINAELLARAHGLGLVILEVGVRHRSRQGGRSTVRAVDLARTFSGLLKLRRRLRRGARAGVAD